MNHSDRRFHVIVVSNFAKGFDKYAFAYGKAGIPESTFPDRFHLLTRAELGIGIAKARRLLDRLDIPGDRLLVLETTVDPGKLLPNVSTNLGTELREASIRLSAVHELDQTGDEFALRPTTVEDAMAASLRLHGSAQRRYADTRPRSVSLLPVASACQARCSFCFSSASISSDQAPARVPWDAVAHWLERARAAGAERAVITGGGEPTLIPFEQQLRLVSACSAAFPKVVLITNAHTLAKDGHADRADRLAALSAAGLSVLAVSRHHQDDAVSERLMMLRTPVSSVIDTWREERERRPGLRMRLICVLQHGGVADAAGVADYLRGPQLSVSKRSASKSSTYPPAPSRSTSTAPPMSGAESTRFRCRWSPGSPSNTASTWRAACPGACRSTKAAGTDGRCGSPRTRNPACSGNAPTASHAAGTSWPTDAATPPWKTGPAKSCRKAQRLSRRRALLGPREAA